MSKSLIVVIDSVSEMGMHSDHRRFTGIVKGRVKKNLKDYLGSTDLFRRKGDKTVTIPVPHIDLPHFRFDTEKSGGLGAGEGTAGTPYDPDTGETGRKAGDKTAEHALEIEVSLDELADMLGSELGLPNIEPKGEDKIISEKYRIKGIASVGPETLRSFQRGYKRALRRMISEGTYDLGKPLVVPTREDMRYRTLERIPSPQSNAIIIYMMDVSGSMGEEQKNLVRSTSFWLSTWIQRFYKGVEERYLIHDSTAREVDRDTFFRTRESGGTMFAPVYDLCMEIIAREYDPSAYNIYPFHFSDGDNFSADDTANAFEILEKHLLPAANMFGYGQCKRVGSDEGHYLRDLKRFFSLEGTSALISAKIRAATLYQKSDIPDALRHFLRTGR